MDHGSAHMAMTRKGGIDEHCWTVAASAKGTLLSCGLMTGTGTGTGKGKDKGVWKHGHKQGPLFVCTSKQAVHAGCMMQGLALAGRTPRGKEISRLAGGFWQQVQACVIQAGCVQCKIAD